MDLGNCDKITRPFLLGLFRQLFVAPPQSSSGTTLASSPLNRAKNLPNENGQVILSQLLTNELPIVLGEGWVMHARPKQKGRTNKLLQNTFRYPIFNIILPIHSLGNLDKIRINPFLSLNVSDYLENGDKSPKTFAEKIADFLQTKLDYNCEKIFLQTLPRMFGYAFNPISFWFCYQDEKLDAILCEVNNTFGDRHFYFIKYDDQATTQTCALAKAFHVSPFFDVSGHYTFEFKKSIDLSFVRIQLRQEGKLMLNTQINLHLRPFKLASTFYLLKKYGWLTISVILKIHFQALKLWLKGAKFYSRPSPPKENLTHEQTKH